VAPAAHAAGADLYSRAVARGPAAALTLRAWLHRSAHFWARAQRLLVFPLAAAAVALLATVPAALAAGEAGGFTTFAAYAVSIDERIVDGLDGAVSPGTDEWILLGAWLVVAQLVHAWATAAFTRSLVERRVVVVPPAAVLARIAVLYLAAAGISLPVFLLGGSDAGAAAASLGLWVVLTVGLLVADYAIAIDELTLRDAVRASLATLRRSPAAAAMAFWLLFASALLVDSLFDDTIAEADDVFPPFLLAAALAHGLRAYLLDCSLIALYLGERDP
jgi:hypothetical protein